MRAATIVEAVSLLLLLGCVALAVSAVRRLRLIRRGGVDVSLRTRLDDPGRGWHLGVARYSGDQFTWFRVSSLRSGPDVVVDRTDLEITDRRPPTRAEVYMVPASAVVLRCRALRGALELAMEPDVLTGFLSWLESTPPGRGPGYRQLA